MEQEYVMKINLALKATTNLVVGKKVKKQCRVCKSRKVADGVVQMKT